MATVWTGFGSDKMYRMTGFTSTVADSADTPAALTDAWSITWDGADALVSGHGPFGRAYRMVGLSSSIRDSALLAATTGITWDGIHTIGASGVPSVKRYVGFSTTLRDSVTVSADAWGVTWDGTYLFTTDAGSGGTAKAYRFVGFSSTLNDSISTAAVDATPAGISWDGTDTLIAGVVGEKLYKLATFTTTISDSIDVSALDDDPAGIEHETLTDRVPAPADATLWCGDQNDKLYKSSGFTMTLLDSLSIGGVDTTPTGITTDGSAVLWCGREANKLYKQSGFTSTLLDSIAVGGVDTAPNGISWDGANSIWSGDQADKIYKQSGFSSSLIDSAAVGGFTTVFGASWDGDHALVTDVGSDKIFRLAGFSGTIAESVSTSGVGTSPGGISWTGTNVIWSDFTDPNGRWFEGTGFSATLTDSLATFTVDNGPNGMEHNRLAERIQPTSPGWMVRPRVGPPARRRRQPRPTGFGDPIVYQLPEVSTLYTLAPRVVRPVRRRRQPRPTIWGPPASLMEPQPELGGWILQNRVIRPVRRRRQPRPTPIAPLPIEYVRRQAAAHNLFHVFNATEYRFYRSNSAPPAESDTPYATSSSLPDTPADTFADGTWWISVSYFNGIIDSGFLPVGPQGQTYLKLTITGGASTGNPPTGPLDWRIENVGDGVVRVVGLYAEFGDNRGDTWAIGRTFDGSTPAADTPDETVAITGTGLVFLNHDLAAQADGVTVKVRLQIRRSTIYSVDSVVRTITADATGPAAGPYAIRWPVPIPEGE